MLFLGTEIIVSKVSPYEFTSVGEGAVRGRTLLRPWFLGPPHGEVTILVGAASWGDSISALRVGHPRGGKTWV